MLSIVNIDFLFSSDSTGLPGLLIGSLNENLNFLVDEPLTFFNLYLRGIKYKECLLIKILLFELGFSIEVGFLFLDLL